MTTSNIRYYKTEYGEGVRVPKHKWVPATWKKISRKDYKKLIQKDRKRISEDE